MKYIWSLVYLASFTICNGNTLLAQTTFEPALGRLNPLSVASGDMIRVTAYPDRSYCCSIVAILPLSSTLQFTALNGSAGLGNTARGRGLYAPELGAGSGATSNRRQCWHEAISSASTSTTLTLGGGSGSVQILCEETTLVGGFNTSVTDFNFLELTVINAGANIFTDTVTGVIYIQRTVAGTTQEIPFSISIDPDETIKRRDISIHDAISGAKDFGAITIVHNGAQSQLKAKVTQYRIVTQTPLDFEPVNQEIFAQK